MTFWAKHVALSLPNTPPSLTNGIPADSSTGPHDSRSSWSNPAPRPKQNKSIRRLRGLGPPGVRLRRSASSSSASPKTRVRLDRRDQPLQPRCTHCYYYAVPETEIPGELKAEQWIEHLEELKRTRPSVWSFRSSTAPGPAAIR